MANRKYAVVWSAATHGIDAIPIEIEAFIAPGLPRSTVVGLPRGAVRECLDRIRAALRTSDLEVPRGAITINLAPADVVKDGTAFDLPVAIALIAALSQEKWVVDPGSLIIVGELALDGAVRSVRGVLSMALWAEKEGRTGIIVPRANAAEASLVTGIDVIPVASLTETLCYLRGEDSSVSNDKQSTGMGAKRRDAETFDFSDVTGQQQAKRALEIAAAGGHNVLMTGAPGSGKTMLARRLPSILPPLSRTEEIGAMRIYSARGLARNGRSSERPFRAPHHSISDAGLVGGGRPVAPGEISLAHNGVLFLDEFPEFKRNAIESLRQPMEQGHIVISRAGSSYRFPSRFMLIAAMNPCPCGYYSTDRPCVCTPGERIRYRNRISGPLLDRIDIHIELMPLTADALANGRHSEASRAIRDRVCRARKVQSARFRPGTGISCNADIPASSLDSLCALTSSARALLLGCVRSSRLSVRGFHRVFRVARTIADLAGQESVTDAAVAEAIQYHAGSRDG